MPGGAGNLPRGLLNPSRRPVPSCGHDERRARAIPSGVGTPKRITERVASPFAGCTVDREAGVIRGVLVCGTVSANGRDYPAEVLKRDHKAYEGRPVNCDHASESTVGRRFGWLSNVRPGDDGRPRADLNVLKAHPMFGPVMEAAERNPALFGLSHVAMCETRRVAGRERVEAIKSVESVDLVADPATTHGFFESQSKGKNVPLTIKQLVESLVKHPKTAAAQVRPLKALAEMDGMGELDTGTDAAPPDDAEPTDGIKDAFSTACMHCIQQALDGEMDPKEALTKLKKLIASHGEVNGGDAPADPPEPDDETAEGKKAPKVNAFDLLAECDKLGFRPSGVQLKALSLLSIQDRAQFIAEQKQAAPGETVKSTGRKPGGSAGAAGVKTEAKPVPTDGKGYAALIRE